MVPGIGQPPLSLHTCARAFCYSQAEYTVPFPTPASTLLAMWPEMTAAVALAAIQGQAAVLVCAPKWSHSLVSLQERSSCAMGQLCASDHLQQSPGSPAGVCLMGGFCGVFCIPFPSLEQ